jgi:hypothetical protein
MSLHSVCSSIGRSLCCLELGATQNGQLGWSVPFPLKPCKFQRGGVADDEHLNQPPLPKPTSLVGLGWMMGG